MHKLLIAALAATFLVPGAVSAQSARELRHDQAEINRDKAREARQAANGDYRRAARTRQELREDRNERREDWRAYRRTHRNVYTRPAYVWPRGYSYRPVTVGTVLDQLLFGSRYRINNYGYYRLPYPGRNRAWVRYGNDALLINVRNGRVITVYNNFFY